MSAVRPPSDLAVEAVARFGGRIVEADVRAQLVREHGHRVADRGISFALLWGSLRRTHVGAVAVLTTEGTSR